MKSVYNYIAALALVSFAQSLNAQKILNGKASIEHVKIEKKSDLMVVSMDIVPNQHWETKKNQAIVLTPVVENTETQVQLPAIQIMGRNRYLHYLRNTSKGADKSNVYKASETQAVHYEASIPYQDWMDQSTLMLNEDLCGCCQTQLASEQSMLGKHEDIKTFTPVLAYIVPKAEAVKNRSESGQAYVTFPVSQSVIKESYLNNKTELQKILNTLSQVRNDQDVTVTGMRLKGYASPEGSYRDNERLAKSRTEAVANFVKMLLGKSQYPISTSYEAENWEGLEEFVQNSDWPERKQLLTIINSSEYANNPDERERKIKTSYPNAYRRLLKECYPSLRKTDYWVEFTVRSFNLEEAKELIATHPQKLSLQEMYNVAQTYEPGSEAYNEVFATAVRMFPQDATANLNAANSALQRGDVVTAEKYLQNAGDSGESVLARGVLAMMKGDATKATELLRQAQSMGIQAASANLEQIQKIQKNN